MTYAASGGECHPEGFKSRQSFRAQVMWSDGKTHGLMFTDQPGKGLPSPEASPRATSPQAALQRSGVPTSEIQAVVDEARHRIAQLAGFAPEAVRLKLEIDY